VKALAHTLLVAVGTLSVALGVVGIFVPLLPTTPFLLLAAYCYARSSERFYHRLMTNRWLGAYIRDYREGRGIPRRTKVVTVALLWLTMGHAILFVVPAWWVDLLLFALAASVTVFLLTRRTRSDG
jgi:hypothetical protein